MPDDERRAATLAELYRRLGPLIHARARRMVGDDADDIVQEVFIKLIRDPPAEDAQVTWIYRTSTNLCIDRIRYRKRRDADWEKSVEHAIQAHRGSDIETVLSDRELSRKLLARMDRKTQQVVMLVLYDEMTQEDAAAALGISRKTVAQRLDRFRTKARKMVKRWLT